MSARPRLIDLYCCAGGAARGYQRAGFHVIGVDIEPQPNYAGDEFIKADVLAMTPADIRRLGDAVHASPKCQGQTRMRAPGRKQHVNQIPATRALLEASGRPWILENVEGAEPWMPGAITLCGTMFDGLESEAAYLERHRLFIASFPISAPSACRHDPNRPVGGVYGGHARIRSKRFGGRGTRDVWRAGHRLAMGELMGMDWATCAEMSEAIPPAYTEWLGRQLLAHIQQVRAA
jgi:DNA (cytosine-5)-methyltransferase 1